MRDSLDGEGVILASYIYRDMLISVYLQKYFESDIRKEYHTHLFEIRVIPKKTRSGLQGFITKMSILEDKML
jgi:hypothetical protein